MERLTAQDLSMLWPDDVGWPQDIGALGVLEGHRLFGPDGRVQIQLVRQAIESHLHRVPRFRQILYVPRRGLGWPLWVDAPAFDISDHVKVRPLSIPATEDHLLRTVEQLRRSPLDRAKPLWQLWMLPGLPDGRVGLYMKVHHVIADGIAGVAALGALLDTSPTTPLVPGPPRWPEPAPSAGEMIKDNVRRRLAELRRATSAFAPPISTLGKLPAVLPALGETFGTTPVPRTSFNRPVGERRRLAVVRSRLDTTKHIAHTHGATVNDVLLTALAGGLRDLLAARGEVADGLALRAYVPVSLRRERSANARGNHNALMIAPLPVGVADPVRRLRLIADETALRRRRPRPAAGTLLRNGLIQRTFLPLMARQRWANAYVANVPGAAAQLYLAGAHLTEVFPIVPLIGNVTIGVGALSYAGQLAITVVADEDACPDVDVFTDGVRHTLHLLAASVRPARTERGMVDHQAWTEYTARARHTQPSRTGS